jgi:hypothetical protein
MGGVKIITSLSLLLLAGAAHAQLVPRSTAIGGKSQVEWSQAWWAWAASFDQDHSPVADRTGRLCHLEQEGPVWFLAGTYGTARTIRVCSVPRGKYLFFPLINYVYYKPPDSEASCADMRRSAAAATDDVSSLVLELDGKRFTGLEAHRLATVGCFDLNARDGGGVPAAANGYYVMLEPLGIGKHSISFGGRTEAMSQAVTYTLYVN